MRSSIYGRWIRGHYFQSHILIPAIFSLLLIGMYFSGSALLQGFVAGSPFDSSPRIAAETRALSLLQDVFLLCALFFSLRNVFAARGFAARFFTLVFLIVITMTFLGETDNGRHLSSLIGGNNTLTPRETWELNWQNQGGATAGKIDNALLLSIQLGVLALFVLLPPLMANSKQRTLGLLSPAYWAVITAIMTLAFWRLAIVLNNGGHAIIEGEEGNLERDLSEFLELGLYYLVLLYCAVLHERLIARLDAPIARRPDF